MGTHMLGKWHLGFFTQNHTPVGRGFDSYFGYFLGQSSHDNRSSQESHTCRTPVKDLFNGTFVANTSDYYKNNIYNTHMYASEAERIIMGHDPQEPLFLYMAFQNCHGPYQAPEEYQDMYPSLPKGKSQRCYNAMVTALDESIGRIVEALKKSGLYGNSVIVFTSDNGGPAKMANNMPLRGAKFSVFQGGLRTAAVVHSPLLPKHLIGGTTDKLIYISDWYVTFATLAGVQASRIINGSGPVPSDGFNVWPAITEPTLSPRTMIVHEHDEQQGVYAIRSGQWKLIWGKIGTTDWIEDQSYDKGCVALHPPINSSMYPGVGLEAATAPYTPSDAMDLGHASSSSGLKCTEAAPCLFDVLADPEEHNETAKHHPDIVEDLKQKLADYVAPRYTKTLDIARTSQGTYCTWIEEVGWVQPYEEMPPASGNGCSVKVLEQASSRNCSDGTGNDQMSFGCFAHNNTMWTYYGCRGTFMCNGAKVSCPPPKAVGVQGKPYPEWKPAYNLCSCEEVVSV